MPKKYLMVLASVLVLVGWLGSGTLARATATDEAAPLDKWGDWFLETVPQNKTIAHTAFVANDYVVIEGAVEGDLWCAGQRVVIRGNVAGDVFCAANEVIIEGQVAGDARLLARRVRLTGSVGKNLNFLGEELEQEPSAAVGGEVLFVSKDVWLQGLVGRSLAGTGMAARLNNVVGDVWLSLGRLEIGPQAKIKGNLTYQSANKITVSSTQVTGVTTYYPPEKPNRDEAGEKAKVTGFGATVFKKLFRTVSLALCGLLFFALFPKLVRAGIAEIKLAPLNSLGYGFLTVIVAPLTLVLAIFTLVGWRAALFGLILLIGGGLVGSLLASLALAEQLLQRFASRHAASTVLKWVVAYAGIFIISWLPFLGWLLFVLLNVAGFGALIKTIKKNRA